MRCFVLLVSALLVSGCASTHSVSSDYSPRLSSRGESVKQSLASKSTKPTFYILNFEDERTRTVTEHGLGVARRRGIKESGEITKPMEPNVVWTGKGIHKYEFADKTVAQYLRDALVFDLKRFGFMVDVAEPGGLSALALENDEKALAVVNDAQYLLGVRVFRFEPSYETGWANLTPKYAYEYKVVLWNAVTGKVEVDEVISKNIQGLATPVHTFADLIDQLINIHLADMNIAVAELLVTYD